ncbi:MAG: FecR domain-containing protein [Hyphomicrobiales bacterium]|nr:FecR domain-containing protein [Hyphomicrobiales bacterium]
MSAWAALLVLPVLILCGGAQAGSVCSVPIGFVASLQGQVDLRKADTGAWSPATLSAPLCAGDIIRVGDRSRALATISGQPTVRIDQNSTLRLVGAPKNKPFLIQFMEGAAYFFSRRPRTLTINTPLITAGIKGTEFVVRAEQTKSLITVFEGEVDTHNPHGRAAVAAGETVIARAGEAPRRYILAKPRDAVQWVVHYPVILLPLADRSGVAVQTAPPALRTAVGAAARNDFAQAFGLFDRIAGADRDAVFYVYRAATLLNVGRADEAEADIEQALAVDPQNGEVYALRAVIAAVRNERAETLADAQRAVELSPRSAAAKIALSYAQQAYFDLKGARQTLEQAVADEPDNALAWARLSELWLMLGQRRRAVKKARKARDLAPRLERTLTVLSYALLTAFEARQAQATFAQAIALDPASPLPRFGLGLAKIRQGRLSEGRVDIESAVALDPENALLRSYLGKAYFEERTTRVNDYFKQLIARITGEDQPSLAGQQFTIAKGLDPYDPTPWFYDAIRKQSENRPVEALRDLEKSIELNDNRAVYRSRQLLDEDRAARGVSQARIYNDLGFEQLGINEATRSIALDPSNAAAHRFLSDVYANQPRNEIARVSELLQAQLLQDININPVQPSLNQTHITGFAGGGPTRPGFNEFTPLFERNQAQLNVTGVVGSNQTFGDEVVVSGIYDWLSISAGQNYYNTQGFRKNDDIRTKIYNIYAQAAASENLNIQTELISTHTETGDTTFNYDRDFFSENFQRDLDVDSQRVGVRYNFSSQSTVIASFIHTERSDTQSFFQRKDEGYQGEGQYVYQDDYLNFSGGAGSYFIDREIKLFPDFVDDLFNERPHSDIDHHVGFTYVNILYPKSFIWSFGLSYDDYHEDDLDIQHLNPRLGLQWDVIDDLTLRFAAFRVLKPSLVARQTIQPTQVAGFNQYFDDIDGTESVTFGAGLDYRFSQEVSVGVEALHRDLKEPVLIINEDRIERESREEQLYRTYLYWTPTQEWALQTGLSYDIWNGNSALVPQLPNEVRTLSLPITARFFHPTGLFTGLAATFVRQNVHQRNGSSNPEGDDSFIVLDFSLGYRLPQRRGLISLDINNLFDSGFDFQDESFRGRTDVRNEPVSSQFIPERTILLRTTLSF